MKVKCIYIPALSRLPYSAITLYPFILFFSSKPNTWYITYKHEMVHVSQIRQYGFLSFYASYLLYFIANLALHKSWTKAYEAIPFEIQARQNQCSPLTLSEANELDVD